MSRIRSIKPDFWISEQIVELSPTTRLLFIGMWSFCDDQGAHPASVKTLKMEIFPGDDFTVVQIQEMVSEMISAGLVSDYQGNDGKKYWFVTGWAKHQKIEKPNYKYPAPPKFADQSANSRRLFAEHSTPEGSGVERSGKEGSESENAHAQNLEENVTETATALPDSTDPNDLALAPIQEFLKNNDNAEMKFMRDRAKFPAATVGEFMAIVRGFISFYLTSEDFAQKIEANPVDFFRRRFPKWLEDEKNRFAPKPSAATGSKNRPIDQPATYSPPPQRDEGADFSRSEAQARAMIEQHAPLLADQFTAAHIWSIRTASQTRSATDMVLAIAQTISSAGAFTPTPEMANFKIVAQA